RREAGLGRRVFGSSRSKAGEERNAPHHRPPPRVRSGWFPRARGAVPWRATASLRRQAGDRPTLLCRTRDTSRPPTQETSCAPSFRCQTGKASSETGRPTPETGTKSSSPSRRGTTAARPPRPSPSSAELSSTP
ncbi:hypothetical protein LY76DRAFT_682556, partial [Colletotrichum caudatum]